MKSPHCIKCFRKLEEGDYREQTLKGSICGDCYDILIKSMGWGEYSRLYLGYGREPRDTGSVSSEMDAWNDIGGAG